MNVLFKYLEKIGLPNASISKNGAVSDQFLSLGITDLYHAVDYVHKLPYGIINNKSDYIHSVFKERRGTCSPKHALIATLAKEQGISLILAAGILIMNAKTMPKMSAILAQYALNGVPEAHVFLKYHHYHLDITFPDKNIFNPPYKFLKEIIISTDQIGEFKDEWHRQAIIEWLHAEKLNYQLDEIWKIRELCIKALSTH